ncbi:prolyl oligopeptidase family serine peptidase [Pedobacter sp.]|uniref:alpha/beta hydrolase family protein n=1 Tax=Pedobacter sp. TaxID=1411316 RepID=UPI003D7F9376
MKKLFLHLFLLTCTTAAIAQDAASYQAPPQEMADLLLAKPTPGVSIGSKAQWMLLSDRNPYPSVEELAMPEYRIAGLRINPENYSLSRQTYINGFTLIQVSTNKATALNGLPSPLFAGNVQWNPTGTKISFTNTTGTGVDLYVIDIATAQVTKVNKQPLNVVLGNGISWIDNQTLLYQVAVQPASAAPKKPLMPKGPTTQQNLGKAAPSATYQDLIKSPYDETLFEFFATSQLVKNTNGVETPIGKPAIYLNVSVSPDKNYLLQRKLRKPFSYLVSAYGFPSSVEITDLNGKSVKVLAELPSAEGRPSGYDNLQNIARNFDWRDDVAATVTWAQPLDSGLIKKDVEFHDAVFALAAPFTGKANTLFKTKTRFRSVIWGDENIALVQEGLRSKQSTKLSRLNPATGKLETLYEGNQTDAYNNPGFPVMAKNKYGRYVVKTVDNGKKLLMNNTTGSSAKGDLPFLAKFDLKTKKNDIIWRSAEGTYEFVADVLDADKLVLLTRKESQQDVPNYYIKNLVLRIADQKLTSFENPYPAMVGVIKEKISYKRSDGIDLTGDLYLPKGYDKAKDGALPLIIWAYPREFNSAADAAQIRGSKHRFTTISWASPIYWVTQGYAVLDNAEMPIVAANGKKPNDTFVDQLKMNAEAAINNLAGQGIADKNRVAVGGHSYGAFMTANLLAHTNLFKAGLARSGAYNRTLTPFGFQNEDRTYWDAPQLYFEMSPFSYANKIKTPLLLIHGDSDDNPGTFPINSERLFNAVKGFGGTTRLVFLPYEAHSYKGKENILHMLWEMNAWLDTYVKKAK